MRTTLGVLFLALQVTLVLASRRGEERYFCWAPHTAQVRFSAEVEVGDRSLTPAEVQRRYRLHSAGWEAHSAANLIDTIERYESTLGRGDRARVRLSYRVNGHEERRWNWP